MQLDDAELQQSARVELLPLIDVVFLLLVFFIFVLLSMTVQRGLPVELPRVDSAETITRESVQISITREGELAVNGDTVMLAQLVGAVQAALKPADAPVIIQGDKQAHLGIALQVLERLSQAGIGNIAFAAERSDSDD